MLDRVYAYIVCLILGIASVIGVLAIAAFCVAVQQHGIISIIDKFMSL